MDGHPALSSTQKSFTMGLGSLFSYTQQSYEPVGLGAVYTVSAAASMYEGAGREEERGCVCVCVCASVCVGGGGGGVAGQLHLRHGIGWRSCKHGVWTVWGGVVSVAAELLQ
jgi:hypothetical protein